MIGQPLRRCRRRSGCPTTTISTDYRLDPAASEPLKIDLVDPDGTVVAALAWSPGRLGSEAYAGVSPAVLAALLLVALTMAFSSFSRSADGGRSGRASSGSTPR